MRRNILAAMVILMFGFGTFASVPQYPAANIGPGQWECADGYFLSGRICFDPEAYSQIPAQLVGPHIWECPSGFSLSGRYCFKTER